MTDPYDPEGNAGMDGVQERFREPAMPIEELLERLDDQSRRYQSVILTLPEWADIRARLRPTPTAADTPWQCGVRASNNGPHDPADCNWPMCSCDPHADKVIAALQESGLLLSRPLFPAAADTPAGLEPRWDQLGPIPTSPELEDKLARISHDEPEPAADDTGLVERNHD